MDPSRPTNRLAGESSPYLRLHAHNPVDWYPWGPEALEAARRDDKPIFLSVGYSTCYWCHVMERESFSDPEVAALMNRTFINIKVDREERPDLDEIYMAATQLLAEQGGWPNSVFLTPKLQPFYAGTYFPPRERYGRPGFGALVLALGDAWKHRRPQIESQAEEVAAALERFHQERLEPGDWLPSPEVAVASLEALARRFDPEWGGFSPAPKFPSPANLFLLHELAGGYPEAAGMLTTTLDRMARGGLFDQLGGGFHRYATDLEWKVPHFEKMLYDNGLLLEVYALEHGRTGDPEWARVARETVAFLERELAAPEGGFWSAIDAETDGHEGAFYVWSGPELNRVLGPEDATFAAPLLGFEGKPFFEGSSYVLHRPRPVGEAAAARRMSREALLAELEPLRARLLATRAERPRPATDDKILTDWNGLAIAGLATAGRVLGEPAWVARAERAARFVWEALRPAGGPLLHVWRTGEARIPAFLADYAFLIHGFLALDQAGAEGWLERAAELADEQIARLEDPVGGFFSAPAQPDLLMRKKDAFDGATPSPNGRAALNLLRLAERTGEPRFREAAERSLRAFAPLIEGYPDGARTLSLAALRAGGGQLIQSPEREARSLVTAQLRATPGPVGEPCPFELTIDIAPGWHLQAHPASLDYLVPTAVLAEGADLLDLVYPEAELLTLSFEASEPLRVYQGQVRLTGTAIPRDLTWRLLVQYQACNDQRCLPVVVVPVRG